MAIDYKTLAASGTSEVTEKKSRFIGEAYRISSKEEVEEHLSRIRKHYYDARHHCYAYLAGEPGSPEETVRSSDDGEPSGTAGKPILEVLTGRGLHNVLIVVTRYFGGTLLGTGGLVRAYSQAAREAVEDAGIVMLRSGVHLTVTASYTQLGKLQYEFTQAGFEMTDTEYTDEVRIHLTVPESWESRVRKMVTEATGGTAAVENRGLIRYEEKISVI